MTIVQYNLVLLSPVELAVAFLQHLQWEPGQAGSSGDAHASYTAASAA